MKLHLINFLCYTDSEFNFGAEGLTLVSGPSGCGKTSILRGIFFVLFGDGNKVQTYGKTSCTVKLEFEDLKITRTKRPNHLVVNDVYEDDVAQEILNKRFGNTFKTSGYIQQNNLASFMLMTPHDKLNFLEKFAFEDINIEKIKAKCKHQITELHDKLIGTVAQLDMSNKILVELEEPTKVSFPIKCKISNREVVIKNQQIKLKNTSVLYNKTSKIKARLIQELEDNKLLLAKIQTKQEHIISWTTKLEDLQQQQKLIKYIGDEELLDMEQILTNLINKRELLQYEKQYDQNMHKLEEMYNEELQILHKEIETIDQNIWQEYTQEELTTTIKDIKDCLTDIASVERLKQELKEHQIEKLSIDQKQENLVSYTNQIENKQELISKLRLQQETYHCPVCESSLQLINEELIATSIFGDSMTNCELQTLLDELKSLKLARIKLQKLLQTEEYNWRTKVQLEDKINKITSQYEELPTSKSLRDDLHYLQKYELSQLHLEQSKKELTKRSDNETLSSSYRRFKRDTEDIAEKISTLLAHGKFIVKKYQEEEVRKTIFEQQSNKIKLEELLQTKNTLEQEKTEWENIILELREIYCDKYIKIKDQTDLEQGLQEQEQLLIKLALDKEEYDHNILNISKWEKYQEEYKKYTEWKTKINILIKQEKEERNKYAAALILKNKILEAESIAITNIIETINNYARNYLDCFFVDNPISVQLQPFKESKKVVKPSINILIEYKSMECDLSMLSGGELSRITLAYTLALSEIFNTPVLLLDECTSSLDQDLTNIVFDGIRNNFNGKLVLIIAHQVISGTFDNIISLK